MPWLSVDSLQKRRLVSTRTIKWIEQTAVFGEETFIIGLWMLTLMSSPSCQVNLPDQVHQSSNTNPQSSKLSREALMPKPPSRSAQRFYVFVVTCD